AASAPQAPPPVPPRASTPPKTVRAAATLGPAPPRPKTPSQATVVLQTGAQPVKPTAAPPAARPPTPAPAQTLTPTAPPSRKKGTTHPPILLDENTQIDRFGLIREIARGGMGQVFL